MNNIESAITKAIKNNKKTGKTLYVYATYYKVCIDTRKPAFGAAHWVVKDGGFTRVESTL